MLRDRNIVVTGGCGFIGSNLAEKLCEENNVTVIDNLCSGKVENIRDFTEKVVFHKLDIRNEIEGYFTDIDIVFHEAANVFIEKSIQEPFYDAYVNVLGTLNVLEACRKNDVERLVFASSSAVYGNPIFLPIREDHPLNLDSPYAASKAAGEYYCRVYNELYGLETVMLRYFNVYGRRQDPFNPYSGVIAVFMNNALNNKSLTIYGNGEQIRDFIHIDDVVRANLLASKTKKGIGGIFNIGTGEAVSIDQLAEMIRGFRAVGIEYAPPRLGDIEKSVANTSNAMKVLKFKAMISLSKGLKEYFSWFVENSNGQDRG